MKDLNLKAVVVAGVPSFEFYRKALHSMTFAELHADLERKEMSNETELPVVAGKSDKSIGPVRFATIKEAEAWIEEREKVDPTGVAAGHYYIDAPEEMVNGHVEDNEKYALTPLGYLIASGNRMAEALKTFPDFDELRRNWNRDFARYLAWAKERAEDE